MSTLAWYFLKLFVLLPMIAGMAYGLLWFYRKYQPGLMGAQANRTIKLIDALPMGTSGKLAVVEFEGKRLLLAVTRGRIEKVAESDVA